MNPTEKYVPTDGGESATERGGRITALVLLGRIPGAFISTIVQGGAAFVRIFNHRGEMIVDEDGDATQESHPR